jgi:hypothetical protein
MNCRVFFVCVISATLLLLVSATASAQTVQGVITGTVTDPSGAVVPNARVTITNIGTGITQTTTTSTTGLYRFSLVPPGDYTASVTAAQFAEYKVGGIHVDASGTVPLNIKLELQTAQVTVEVSQLAPLVQTANSELNFNIDRQSLENIPLLSRNVYDLAFAAPQVTQGMNFNAASGGARESGTQYLLNGADNNDNFSEGGFNVTPPLESVDNFTLLTNSMSAQYGRGGGATVTTVQKSGTNHFHGALYEFNRNTDFNANDFFSNLSGAPRPHYVRNQFGGEIDGPIYKNKTFFAFALDRVSLHTGETLVSAVPTPASVASMTTNAGPLAQSILSKYPPVTSTAPCPPNISGGLILIDPATGLGIGCDVRFNPFDQPQNTYYGRVDHNFSVNNRLSFSANVFRFVDKRKYSGGHLTTVGPIPSTDRENYHNLALVDTHVFGPRVVNELTIGHNRHFSSFVEGTGKSTDPEIAIDNASFGSVGIGFGVYEGGQVENFTQDRWLWQDNVSWTFGKHSLKFGGNTQYGILYRNWDLGGPGYYEFGNMSDATGGVMPCAVGGSCSEPVLNPDGSITAVNNSDDSNFQHDFPYFQELSIDPATGTKANAYRHYTMHDASLFIQDDWKVKPRLTLNLGLRWEQFGAPGEVHNIIAQLTNIADCPLSISGLSDTAGINCVANARTGPVKRMWPTRNRDFGPRVGFAWDVFGNGRMAVRGGFGVYFDRIFDNVWSNGAWNPPFYGLLDADASGSDTIFYSDPPSTGTAYDRADPIPNLTHRVSVRTMDVHLKDTSTQNYYLGVEHQFASNFLFRANYQGSLGRHLPVLMNVNRYDGDRYNSSLALRRPNPLYTGFNYRANRLTSNYNALVTELQKRMSNGIQFQFGYTFSKLIDYGSDLFSGETTTGQFSQPYYFVSNNAANLKLEKGRGGFDHTHGLKFNFVYQIPFMKSGQGFLGHVLGGWQVSSFFQSYSGHPIEVYNSRVRVSASVRDANGNPYNIGGDYNLDGVGTDHPDFVGSSINAAYSGASPAKGIFKDNNPIGCETPGTTVSAAEFAACDTSKGVATANSLFVNPSYANGAIRYGHLGRNVFHGPWFTGFDASIGKTFPIGEQVKLQFRAEALNIMNHPNFDGINTDLSGDKFGKSQCTVGDATCPSPSAPSRRLQLGLRLTF